MDTKLIDFSVVKQKIIKTDRILQLFMENKNQLRKAVKAYLDLKSKFELSELERERCVFSFESLKSKYDNLEIVNSELNLQKISLEQKYNQYLMTTQNNIKDLEDELHLSQNLNKDIFRLDNKKLSNNSQTEPTQQKIQNHCKRKNKLQKENLYVEQISLIKEEHIKTITNLEDEKTRILEELQEMKLQVNEHTQVCDKRDELQSIKLSLENRISQLENENKQLQIENSVLKQNSLCNSKAVKIHVSVETDETSYNRIDKQTQCTEIEFDLLETNESLSNIFKEMINIPELLSPLRSYSPIMLDSALADEPCSVSNIISTCDSVNEFSSNSQDERSTQPLCYNIEHVDNESISTESTSKYTSRITDSSDTDKFKYSRYLKSKRSVRKRKYVRHKYPLKQRSKNRNSDSILRALQILKRSKLNFTISNAPILPIYEGCHKVLKDNSCKAEKNKTDPISMDKSEPSNSVSEEKETIDNKLLTACSEHFGNSFTITNDNFSKQVIDKTQFDNLETGVGSNKCIPQFEKCQTNSSSSTNLRERSLSRENTYSNTQLDTVVESNIENSSSKFAPSNNCQENMLLTSDSTNLPKSFISNIDELMNNRTEHKESNTVDETKQTPEHIGNDTANLPDSTGTHNYKQFNDDTSDNINYNIENSIDELYYNVDEGKTYVTLTPAQLYSNNLNLFPFTPNKDHEIHSSVPETSGEIVINKDYSSTPNSDEQRNSPNETISENMKCDINMSAFQATGVSVHSSLDKVEHHVDHTYHVTTENKDIHTPVGNNKTIKYKLENGEYVVISVTDGLKETSKSDLDLTKTEGLLVGISTKSLDETKDSKETSSSNEPENPTDHKYTITHKDIKNGSSHVVENKVEISGNERENIDEEFFLKSPSSISKYFKQPPSCLSPMSTCSSIGEDLSINCLKTGQTKISESPEHMKFLINKNFKSLHLSKETLLKRVDDRAKSATTCRALLFNGQQNNQTDSKCLSTKHLNSHLELVQPPPKNSSSTNICSKRDVTKNKKSRKLPVLNDLGTSLNDTVPSLSVEESYVNDKNESGICDDSTFLERALCTSLTCSSTFIDSRDISASPASACFLSRTSQELTCPVSSVPLASLNSTNNLIYSPITSSASVVSPCLVPPLNALPSILSCPVSTLPTYPGMSIPINFTPMSPPVSHFVSSVPNCPPVSLVPSCPASPVSSCPASPVPSCPASPMPSPLHDEYILPKIIPLEKISNHSTELREANENHMVLSSSSVIDNANTTINVDKSKDLEENVISDVSNADYCKVKKPVGRKNRAMKSICSKPDCLQVKNVLSSSRMITRSRTKKLKTENSTISTTDFILQQLSVSTSKSEEPTREIILEDINDAISYTVNDTMYIDRNKLCAGKSCKSSEVDGKISKKSDNTKKNVIDNTYINDTPLISSEFNSNESTVKRDDTNSKKSRVLKKDRPVRKKTKLQSKIMRQLNEKRDMLKLPIKDENIDNNITIKEKLGIINENKTNKKINIFQNILLTPPTSNIDLLGLNSKRNNKVSNEDKSIIPSSSAPIKKSVASPCDIVSQIMSDMDKERPRQENVKNVVTKKDAPTGLDGQQWRKRILDIAEVVHTKDVSMEGIYGDRPCKRKRQGILRSNAKLPEKHKFLINKLLAISNEDCIPEDIIVEFKRFAVDYVIDVIIYQVSKDQDEPDHKYYPAPLMTRTQRIFLGLIVTLEKDKMFESITEDFLFRIQEHIFRTGCGIQAAIPLTHLYLSVCRLNANINRMRTFCCEAFFYAGDLAIPIFFAVLSSWTEVLPLQADVKNYSMAKVLVQLVHLKTFAKSGYNLFPLKCFLAQYYGYPKERWNCDDVFKDIFMEYLANPAIHTDYAIRLFCKNKDSKWVYKKLNEYLKPLIYKIPSENVNLKSSVIVLMGKICRQFKPKNSHDNKCLVELKRWFEGLLEDDTQELIKQSVDYTVQHLPSKEKKPTKYFEKGAKILQNKTIKL